MKSIEVLYNPLAVFRLKNFLDVHTTDESIIDAAWEQYAYAQNYSAQTLAEITENAAKNDVKMIIASPRFILPFD